MIEQIFANYLAVFKTIPVNWSDPYSVEGCLGAIDKRTIRL